MREYDEDGLEWNSLLGYDPVQCALTLLPGEHHGRRWDFVDFFSGCGGMSYGWHAVGEKTGMLRAVAAFDIDVHANNTYRHNLGLEPSDLDLAVATVGQLKGVLASGGRDEAVPLVCIGCAPCQGFSSHRKKDSRRDQRNGLVERFAEIAVGLNAELIVMENVPDLLARKHRHHYDFFTGVLSEAGYQITASVVNMAEHGLPQERFRTLVVASRAFAPSLPPPLFQAGDFRTVRDAIGHLPPLEAGGVSSTDPMHTTSKHRPETVEILRRVPKNGGSRPIGVGPKCLDRVAGFYDVYGRLPWDRPSVTITARCRTPSCGRFAHPEQDRGLSVREAALLMGFPPSFQFTGPFDDKFKQAGNAVPPVVSLRLAAHLLAQLCEGRQLPGVQGLGQPPLYGSYSSVIAHLKKEAGKQEDKSE